MAPSRGSIIPGGQLLQGVQAERRMPPPGPVRHSFVEPMSWMSCVALVSSLWWAGLLEACSLHRSALFLFRSEVVRRKTLQVFVLNGCIFIGSIVVLEGALVPRLLALLAALRALWTPLPAAATGSGDDTASVQAVVVAVYTTLWLYPAYLASSVVNCVLYGDIARHAFRVLEDDARASSSSSSSSLAGEPPADSRGGPRRRGTFGGTLREAVVWAWSSVLSASASSMDTAAGASTGLALGVRDLLLSAVLLPASLSSRGVKRVDDGRKWLVAHAVWPLRGVFACKGGGGAGDDGGGAPEARSPPLSGSDHRGSAAAPPPASGTPALRRVHSGSRRCHSSSSSPAGGGNRRVTLKAAATAAGPSASPAFAAAAPAHKGGRGSGAGLVEAVEAVARGVGEMGYGLLMLTCFFGQTLLLGMLPGVGRPLSLLLLAWLYAYYCFEYRWAFEQWRLDKRLRYFETNWAFFAGFGTPCVVATLLPHKLISAGVMALLFPLFVLAAMASDPAHATARAAGPARSSARVAVGRIPIFRLANAHATFLLTLLAPQPVGPRADKNRMS
eukprot:jgi/Mesen1/4917/ME000246S04143